MLSVHVVLLLSLQHVFVFGMSETTTTRKTKRQRNRDLSMTTTTTTTTTNLLQIEDNVIQDCSGSVDSFRAPKATTTTTTTTTSPWLVVLKTITPQNGTTTTNGTPQGKGVPQGEAEISYRIENQPTVLFLHSYGPTLWKLRIDTNNQPRIVQVVAAGHFGQLVQVTGNTTVVPIEYHQLDGALTHTHCPMCDVHDFGAWWSLVEKTFGQQIFSYDSCEDASLFRLQTTTMPIHGTISPDNWNIPPTMLDGCTPIAADPPIVHRSDIQSDTTVLVTQVSRTRDHPLATPSSSSSSEKEKRQFWIEWDLASPFTAAKTVLVLYSVAPMDWVLYIRHPEYPPPDEVYVLGHDMPSIQVVGNNTLVTIYRGDRLTTSRSKHTDMPSYDDFDVLHVAQWAQRRFGVPVYAFDRCKEANYARYYDKDSTGFSSSLEPNAILDPNIPLCPKVSTPISFKSTRSSDKPWILVASKDDDKPTSVHVNVDIPNQPVVLVLSTWNEFIQWTVNVTQRSNVGQVLTLGQGKSQRVNLTGSVQGIRVEHFGPYHSYRDTDILWNALEKKFGTGIFSIDACTFASSFRYRLAAAESNVSKKQNGFSSTHYSLKIGHVVLEQEGEMSNPVTSYRSKAQLAPVILVARRVGAQSITDSSSTPIKTVAVNVDLPDYYPVVLVLLSFDPVVWNITASEESTVVRVISDGTIGPQFSRAHNKVIMNNQGNTVVNEQYQFGFADSIDGPISLPLINQWAKSQYGVPVFAYDNCETGTVFRYRQEANRDEHVDNAFWNDTIFFMVVGLGALLSIVGVLLALREKRKNQQEQVPLVEDSDPLEDKEIELPPLC